jgi:hypothetical protein
MRFALLRSSTPRGACLRQQVVLPELDFSSDPPTLTALQITDEIRFGYFLEPFSFERASRGGKSFEAIAASETVWDHFTAAGTFAFFTASAIIRHRPVRHRPVRRDHHRRRDPDTQGVSICQDGKRGRSGPDHDYTKWPRLWRTAADRSRHKAQDGGYGERGA